MNNSISELYSQALDFFKDKTKFAQGYYQYDKEGNKCPWREGYSFCTLGILNYFAGITSSSNHSAICCLQRVSEHFYGEAIQAVNDSEDGYEKIIKALEFSRDLWDGREPTEKELGMSVTDLLEKRKHEQDIK